MKKIMILVLFFHNPSLYAWDDVSIVALLANPHEYHNQEVIFAGAVKFDGSDSGIFLSKEAIENRVASLALGIKISDEESEKLLKHYGNKSYLIVRGTMKAKPKGVISLDTAFQIGYIENVEFLMPTVVKPRKINSRVQK